MHHYSRRASSMEVSALSEDHTGTVEFLGTASSCVACSSFRTTERKTV